MTPSSAVRDEADCRNAANKSLWFLLRLFEFPRLRFTHPEGAKRIAVSQGGGEYFCGRGPELVLGKESATRLGGKYSEPSVRPQGGSRIFQLGVTANRDYEATGEENNRFGGSIGQWLKTSSPHYECRNLVQNPV